MRAVEQAGARTWRETQKSPGVIVGMWAVSHGSKDITKTSPRLPVAHCTVIFILAAVARGPTGSILFLVLQAWPSLSHRLRILVLDAASPPRGHGAD